MSLSEYDRERLIDGVERFITMFEPESTSGIDDATLDHFMIIGIAEGHDEDGDELEVPVMWASTRKLFAQRGIIERMLDRHKSGDYQSEVSE